MVACFSCSRRSAGVTSSTPMEKPCSPMKRALSFDSRRITAPAASEVKSFASTWSCKRMFKTSWKVQLRTNKDEGHLKNSRLCVNPLTLLVICLASEQVSTCMYCKVNQRVLPGCPGLARSPVHSSCRICIAFFMRSSRCGFFN